LGKALEESTMAYDIVRTEIGDDRAASYREGIGNVLKEQGQCQEALIHYEAAVATSERQGHNEIIF
jgi:predicted negative regulator of RcsB-dependent stress response